MIFLERVAEPALWFLGEWSLRWAALIVALAALLLVCRPRRAGTRHLACVAVFCAGLLLPLVPRWGPGWDRSAPPASRGRELLASRGRELLASRGREPPERKAPEPGLEKRGSGGRATGERVAEREVSGGSRPRLTGEVDRPVEKPAPMPTPSWGARQWVVLGLSLAWAGGTLVLLVRLGGGVILLGRWWRQAREPGEEDTELFHACCAEMGLGGRARLGVHPHLLSPITLGLFRPTVLVPAGWADLSREARRGCLLHELAHLTRRDDWWGLLFETVRAVFFFHLPLHWLLARIARERELLCDERAVSLGVDPCDYARVLLDFARRPGRHVRAGLGLASPLCLGRGHTVRARIDHLLEDDMERKLKPLSWSWALTLGLGVVAGGLGAGSVRLLARATEEKPPPARPKEGKGEKPRTPKVPREALRYGGKSFDQWRAELLTELKPDLRIDGIKALGRFGANGYGAEATEAILQMVRGYDLPLQMDLGGNIFRDEDNLVVQAATEAIQKIGAPAVPALVKALEKGNDNVRLFVLSLLDRGPDHFREGRDKLGQSLLRLARETKDPEIRREVLGPLSQFGEPKAVVPVLTEALQDKNPEVRQNAVAVIPNLGKAARPAVPALVKLADDPKIFYQALFQALEAADAEPEVVVPLLAKSVQKKKWTEARDAAHYLGRLGPKAAPAVPALVARLKQFPTSELRSALLNALGKIGPGAREAIPVLENYVKAKMNIQEAQEALKKIRGEDK